jgi:UDP-glucose 4-epimerase
VERFWFASTADVYAPGESAHAEDSPVTPFNIYGLSKWMGEQLVTLEAGYQPRGRFMIGRLFNLYGPRETNPHIIPEILRHLRARPKEPLALGNLWPRRDLVPVRDAARAIIDTMQRAPVGVTTLNIATGATWSMRQVVDLIADLLGRRSHIGTDPAKVRPTERKHLQADVARLRQLIGWTPHANLRQGLTELLRTEGMSVIGGDRGIS